MNNPDVSDINVAIESKLNEQGLLRTSIKAIKASTGNSHNDIFSSLNIPRINANAEPTDIEKNKFMTDNFNNINKLLGRLCSQVQSESSNIQIQIEQGDAKTVTYEFYINGNLERTLKLFLGNHFGGRDYNIGVSCDRYSFGSNNSFNELISSQFVNGQLVLHSMMSLLHDQKTFTTAEAVKAIWTSYVQPYLSM